MIKNNQKTYSPLSFRNVAFNTTNIDLKDEFTLRMLDKTNFIFLYNYYRLNKQKIPAVNILKKIKFLKASSEFLEEIIEVYLDSNDFIGASGYVKGFEITNPNAIHLEFLIKARQLYKIRNREEFLIAVEEGLKLKFSRKFINMLEKNDFDRINYLFYDDYFENLSIPDLEFLHFKFPNLDIFIKRLFKINPFISKELFIEYAKRFNITQIDIMNILSYNCNDWIFKVAIKCNIPDLNSYESIKFYLMNKKEFN